MHPLHLHRSAANAAPTPVAPTPAVSATPDTVEMAKPVLEGKEVVSLSISGCRLFETKS